MERIFQSFKAVSLTSLESNHVGHNLKKVRKSLKLKQCQVADKTEHCTSTISDFERYGTNPKFNTVQNYVKALGAELCVLVSTDSLESNEELASSEILLVQMTPEELSKMKKSA